MEGVETFGVEVLAVRWGTSESEHCFFDGVCLGGSVSEASGFLGVGGSDDWQPPLTTTEVQKRKRAVLSRNGALTIRNLQALIPLMAAAPRKVSRTP